MTLSIPAKLRQALGRATALSACLPALVPVPSRAIDYGVLCGGVSLSDEAPHRYLSEERKAGLQLHCVNLGWNLAEPSEGQWNLHYRDQKKVEIARLRAQGFKIVLEMGISDAPTWVRSIEPFRDQYNHTSSKYVNGIWSDTVRQKITHYIDWIFSPANFGTDFYAVRLGSACHVETLFPDPAPNIPNPNFGYWAYIASL